MAAPSPLPPGTNVVTSGPPQKAILRLALPTVVAMLSQSVVNEIDIVFFARLPCPESSNAQAALLPSLILLWLFGGSLSAISVGTQAYTARRFAEGRHEEAGAVLANAAFFSLVAGVVFTTIGYLTMKPLLHVVLPVAAARNAALSYLNWRLLGITSMVATFAFKSFFDGIGKPHIHLVSAVVMNALNIAMCVLFIFGNHTVGTPRMGIAGAGLAAFVATYIGLAIMIGYALHPSYRAKFRPFDLRKLSWSLIAAILRLSIPSAVATIAVMTGFGLFVAIAGKLDELHPAGMVSALCPGGRAEPVAGASTAVIVGILKLTFTACLAFGTSTATLVAQSLGEKNPDRAATFGWTSVKLGLFVFGFVGFGEAIFAKELLAFVSHSALVQHAALGPLRIMGICTPLIATGMILTQALFGAGNTRFVMIVELILHFTCLVPLAWLLGITMNFGLMGMWTATVVYIVLLSGIMTWKFRSGDWKRITL